MTASQQVRELTAEEQFRMLFDLTAKLNDAVSALLNPNWGANKGILPEGHPLYPETLEPLPSSIVTKPRLLDCGWCYEENGEEVHPHPECPLGGATAPERLTVDTITSDQLDALYETNQRLNRRAQELEGELGAYRRAVRQWEVSERGTYIPHASLRTIGKACGIDILGSVRHLKHFERVEQAEAAIARVRNLATATRDATAPGRNDWQIGQHDLAITVLAALEVPPTPVATEPIVDRPFRSHRQHPDEQREQAETDMLTAHPKPGCGCTYGQRCPNCRD